MGIRFTPGNQLHNPGFNWAERRAAYRQTQEQRNEIYAKHQALVGTLYRNTMAARRAANAELKELPEYWDEDLTPRRPLNITSSCFANIIPAAGGVFLYFRSNPTKGYFYPSAGTKAETAKRVGKLVESPSLGQAYHEYWGAQNGAQKKVSKSGKSYSYKLKGGKTLDLGKFDKLGKKLV